MHGNQDKTIVYFEFSRLTSFVNDILYLQNHYKPSNIIYIISLYLTLIYNLKKYININLFIF